MVNPRTRHALEDLLRRREAGEKVAIGAIARKHGVDARRLGEALAAWRGFAHEPGPVQPPPSPAPPPGTSDDAGVAAGGDAGRQEAAEDPGGEVPLEDVPPPPLEGEVVDSIPAGPGEVPAGRPAPAGPPRRVDPGDVAAAQVEISGLVELADLVGHYLGGQALEARERTALEHTGAGWLAQAQVRIPLGLCFGLTAGAVAVKRIAVLIIRARKARSSSSRTSSPDPESSSPASSSSPDSPPAPGGPIPPEPAPVLSPPTFPGAGAVPDGFQSC